MITKDNYKEFEEKYVEIPPAVYLRDKDISKMQRGEISALIALESFFMNLYAALRFGFAQQYFSPSTLSKAIIIHYYNFKENDPMKLLEEARWGYT